MDETYGIQELAERGGVSRRTVRYYVQQGLLPAAAGTGRGEHYTKAHLERLIRIRQLQEEGVALADIASRLDGRPASRAAISRGDVAAAAASWARIKVADDVELHVRTDRKGPWLLDRTVLRELEATVRKLLGDDKRD